MAKKGKKKNQPLKCNWSVHLHNVSTRSYGVLGILVVILELLRENEALKKFENSKFVLGE